LKLQESKGRFSISIPKDYVKLLGWSKKMELVIYPAEEKGTLLIKEMPK